MQEIRAFLYPNRLKDDGLVVTRRVLQLLAQYGVHALAEQQFAAELAGETVEFLPLEQASAAADCILTIGGDGTLLRACTEAAPWQTPVLGINLGRTGFLATCEVAELPRKLARLAQGDYTLERRSLLHAECREENWHADAVNDVFLYGESRLHPMDYAVFCDGSFVCRYRSDGVIFATPTGSTAYSLSAGGPIVDVEAQAFVMNGICAHGGYSAPLVFSAGRSITVIAESDNRSQVFVCADSNPPCTLKPGGRVEIRVPDRVLNLISFGGAEQFDAIHTKLSRR